MDIQKQVIKIVAEQLCKEEAEVTLDKPFTALGGDSLDQIELMMALEDEFGIEEINDDDSEGITTAQKAINYVTARVKL